MSKGTKVYTGCQNCKQCTNSSAAYASRKLGRVFLGLSTGGMSEVGFAFRKKCRICNHQLSLHKGQKTSSSSVVQQSSININIPTHPSPTSQSLDVKPPPGWYKDLQQPSQNRWWDGTTWTDHTKEFDLPKSE